MGSSVNRVLSRRQIFLARHAAFALASIAIAAAAVPAVLPRTPDAIAARVDHHYNSLHSLRVNFIQEYDGMGMHRRESGILLLSKPGRMRWTYAQPAGKLFVLDGHDAYFYAPGQTEVQRVPAKELDDLRSPLQFLLGHTQIAKELSDLTVTITATNAEGNPPNVPNKWELSGTPKGMEQRVSSFRLTVTPEGIILGIRIEETDGAVTNFTFTGEEANVPVTSGDFVFNAPPGTSIVTGLPPI
jgi:outer membrane lipoprotein carrier protein